MSECCETYVHGMTAEPPTPRIRLARASAPPDPAYPDTCSAAIDAAAPAQGAIRLLDAETDRNDIRWTLNGNEEAYARIVERYESLIFAQMWRFTRDQRILEELVQDVFVEAYMSLSRFRGEAPFLHWLRRIATRVGYRYWKCQRRDANRRDRLQHHMRGQRALRNDTEPSDAAEMLFHMLARLAPKDRLVLTLYYLEDCSTRQIAEQTGWNTTLIRVRIHRACRRLRRLLTEAGYA